MTQEAEIKRAQIVSPKERSKDIPLEWPVEFDGKTYETVTLRRVSGDEVADYVAKVAAADTAEAMKIRVPIVDCPDEVWAALDDDDKLALEEQSLPFLPRRLRGKSLGPILETTENLSGK